MTNRRALGRGLNSLIPDNSRSQDKNQNPVTEKIVEEVKQVQKEEDKKTNSSVVVEERQAGDLVTKLPLDQIKPRVGQPRTNFDEESLEDLANSIREYGLLNPIVVTKKDDHYEILAGERRYRASQKLGKKDIDVIIRSYDNKDVEVLSLVENVQREDLKALEEATAYKKLSDQYHMTQEEIAKTMGKSRSYIANTMRLLNLNDEEKQALDNGKISPSQARTLLSISDGDERSKILNDFISGATNIRYVEKNTKKKSTSTKKSSAPSIDDILLEDLEEKFMDKMGSKVGIKKSGSSYKVTIDCYSIEDVESVYQKLTNETN